MTKKADFLSFFTVPYMPSRRYKSVKVVYIVINGWGKGFKQKRVPRLSLKSWNTKYAIQFRVLTLHGRLKTSCIWRINTCWFWFVRFLCREIEAPWETLEFLEPRDQRFLIDVFVHCSFNLCLLIKILSTPSSMAIWPHKIISGQPFSIRALNAK